jgi:hypothetical protein
VGDLKKLVAAQTGVVLCADVKPSRMHEHHGFYRQPTAFLAWL